MRAQDISVAVVGTENKNIGPGIKCLQLAGINALVYDHRLDLMESRRVLKNCSHIIVKGNSSNYPLIMKLRLAFRGEIINHWIGSDVYNSFGNPKRLARIRISQLFVHQNWVVGERLREPLTRLGIQSKTVPQLIYESKNTPPKKPTKGILVYNPPVSGRENISPYELYGIDKVVELSKRLPDYTFHLVGGGEVPAEIGPCISYGYLNGLDSIWDKVDYYFRVTLSDGLPAIILEATANGVLSVSDYEYFDGICVYKNVDHTADQIRSYQGYQDALERLNRDISKTYSPEAVILAYRVSLKRIEAKGVE